MTSIRNVILLAAIFAQSAKSTGEGLAGGSSELTEVGTDPDELQVMSFITSEVKIQGQDSIFVVSLMIKLIAESGLTIDSVDRARLARLRWTAFTRWIGKLRPAA